ncbi:MAG: hypothetical protein IKJ74_05485 [Clostridia bacterium]|nr:hypothetical protein [Clostridia bacterium]
MKRILAALLCVLMLLSIVACGTEEAKTETLDAMETKAGSEEKKTEEKKTEEVKEEVKYDRVDTPLTPERVAAIPIAREGMTSEELRQICVDYVKLSVSFQWVPNESFDYKANQGGGTPVHFEEGKLHGGIPYINVSSGNLYRMLEFYDVETGVLDVTYLSKNTIIFGTACSGTTGWGWARVINSAVCAWTAQLNANAGLIPVGPYTYDLSTHRFGEDGKEDCDVIAKRNGEQVMYESYALSKKADCFVNKGHVRMNGKDPVVVRNADGTIDGEKSYIVQVEQGLFTTGSYHGRVSADGVEYVIQGNEGKKGDGSDFYYTFKELYKTGYLPHTFKEFHGQDPIEPATVSLDVTGDTVSFDALNAATVTANYVISDVFTVLTDTEGKQLIRYAYRLDHHYSRKAALKDHLPKAYLWQYRDKGYTVSIEVQLGNGELLTAYTGTLVP